MPIDAGVIVGYLVAAAGKQVADRAIGALLDRLAARVSQRLGRAPLDALILNPDDPKVRAYLAEAIRRATAADPEFAGDLRRTQAELDRRGARYLIGDISAPHGQVAVGNNPVAIGNLYATISRADEERATARKAPGWTVGLSVFGFLLCLAGMGLLGYTALTWDPPVGSPDFTTTPDGIKAGFAIFFGGMVVAITGGLLGAAFHKRTS